MIIATKQYRGFTCDIDPCEDRDSVYVTITHDATGLANSLGLLEDMGEFDELPRNSDEPVKISQSTLDVFRKFAEEHGY